MGEFYTRLENPSKSRVNRYRKCDLLKDNETGEILISTREPEEIIVRAVDRYHRVHSHEGERLDVIAHNYYRNPLLWWIIAQANDIYNPLERIPSGTLLRIPDLTSLYGNNGILL